MITKALESFVVTAQAGSFQKASDQLFISSTALIKQINALEEETGLKLFNRTNRGLQLTEEGKAFHSVSVEILHRYRQGIQASRRKTSEYGKPIRIGFSPINPFQKFMDTCFYDKEHFDQFTTCIIPISGEYKDFSYELQNLGSNVDVIPYFSGQIPLETICDSFCLAKLPLRIAVPVGHPLYGKPLLTYGDLNRQTLITISSDVNRYYKVFNEDILRQAPEVSLKPVRYFDYTLLNYAANYHQLMLVGDYFRESHPLLKLHEVAWDHTLPYGVYYSKSPSHIVNDWLQAFRNCGITGNPEDAKTVYL